MKISQLSEDKIAETKRRLFWANHDISYNVIMEQSDAFIKYYLYQRRMNFVLGFIVVVSLIYSFFAPFWLIPANGKFELIDLLSFGFIAGLLISIFVIWQSRKEIIVKICLNIAWTIVISSYVPIYVIGFLIMATYD